MREEGETYFTGNSLTTLTSYTALTLNNKVSTPPSFFFIFPNKRNILGDLEFSTLIYQSSLVKTAVRKCSFITSLITVRRRRQGIMMV